MNPGYVFLIVVAVVVLLSFAIKIVKQYESGVVLLLSQVPAIRHVNRLDLARVTKEQAA